MESQDKTTAANSNPEDGTRVLEVSEGSANQRLDRFLNQAIGISRKRAADLCRRGLVLLNDCPSKKGDLVVEGGVIKIISPEPSNKLSPVPDNSLNLRILHQDDQIIVLDKPAGIHCTALGSGETGTVANFLAARFPEMKGIGLTMRDHGLLHRLDRETSGVILAARNKESFEFLRNQFDERSITKIYLALVTGAPRQKEDISYPIYQKQKRAKQVKVLLHGQSSSSHPIQKALTRYRIREELQNSTLLQVQLVTGVRHQIRAHLAAIGCPILGDPLYGFPTGHTSFESSRLMLHAWKLAFLHPKTGKRFRVTSPIPTEFHHLHNDQNH